MATQVTLNSGSVDSAGSLALKTNGTTTAVTINSSQGVEFNAGTAALPSITTTGDTNTGIFFPAADTIAFSEGGVESARIDSAGNFGLGLTPSANAGQKTLSIATQTGASVALTMGSNYTQAGYIGYNMGNTGTNSTWKYIATDTGSALWFNGNELRFMQFASGSAGATTNGTQAMTLDADGDLGIGVTSPSYKLHVAGTGGTLARFNRTSSSSGVDIGADSGGGVILPNGVDALQFYNAAGTVLNAKIDASGNLLVGGTSVTNSAKMEAFFSGASSNGIVSNDTTSTASTTYFMCSNNGTNIGSITRVASTSAVSYNTTSDQRLKSNIEDAAPVIDKLMSVKVRQYDWTEGDLHQDYGFVAQELEPVLSGIVTKGKTEEDFWQLDYSRLTPHLLKAIQEQQALITTLTARITALEGA